MDIVQFNDNIVKPTLDYLGLNNLTPQRLLIGTALTESKLMYLRQLGNGVALGLYQMEPNTEKDIWENYLAFKPELKEKMLELMGNKLKIDTNPMLYNLLYSTAMTRIHYLRVKEALPNGDDAMALALYHKKYYNSMLGATDPKESVKNFEIAIKLIK